MGAGGLDRIPWTQAAASGVASGIGYTIAWAPPEVLAKNGGGNESSDIYSLGATLFAMLTGQSPYEYGYSEALGATRGKERGTLLRNIILTNPLPKLPPGDYKLVVEAVREVGGREVVSVPLRWPASQAETLRAKGSSELGEIAVELKP